MSRDWYYQLLGEETGPVSFESLQILVREGHLHPDDEVRSSNSGWTKAIDVPDLFALGAIEEPEDATDLDLDLLLSTKPVNPVRQSSNRRGLERAKADAARNADEWFYQLLGQQVGPASHDDIVEQIQLGSLQGNDLVRLGREGGWQPLAGYVQFKAKLAQMQPKPEWYCRILGQVLGPMEFDELQHMAESSSLNPDDEVRLGENGVWDKARQIRGLKFPAATTSSVSAAANVSTHAPFGDAATRKEWYYEILGQQLGPISFQELARAVTEGTLHLEDKARRGKTAAWGLVLDVPGLISVEQKAAYLAAKQEASRPKPVNSAPPAGPAVAVPQSAQSKPSTPAPTAPAVLPPAPNPVQKAAVPTPPPPVVAPSVAPPPAPRPAAPSVGGLAGRPSLPPSFKPPVKTRSSGGFNINWKIVGGVLGVVAIVGALMTFDLGLGGTPGLAEYEKVKVIWEEAVKIHTAKGGAAEWSQFSNKHQAEVKQLEKQITDQKPGATKRLLQLMYFCTKNHLPAIMTDGSEIRYKAMEKDMKEAKKIVSPSL